MNKPHPTKHSGCEGKLVRIFVATRIIYKGDGFYTTDACLTDKRDPADTD